MMGLAPRTFWAMSVKEWAAAVDGFVEFNGSAAARDGVSRDDFEAMKRRFPD